MSTVLEPVGPGGASTGKTAQKCCERSPFELHNAAEASVRRISEVVVNLPVPEKAFGAVAEVMGNASAAMPVRPFKRRL